MNGLRFLEEKRYFIFMHVVMMAFVTLMMFASPNERYDIGDLIYTLTGCSVIASIYLIAGYFHQRTYYRILSKLSESSIDGDWVVLPNPQTMEHRLYQEIIMQLQKRKEKDAEQFSKEQKDYQDFILTWIHEVKLPITACQLLIQNTTGKTVDELIDKLEDEVRKIDHLVEQALYYSRIDSFSKDYLISEIPVHQVVRTSVKKYAKLFVAKRIRFTMPAEELWVHSDRKWLGYIIDQILSNSLKYTDYQGVIECRYEENMDEKSLIIRDSGIGIHSEDIGRVFEKGFTGSAGRTEIKSTGLGLYLANQMAIKLGHRLSIQSEVGKYTQLTIHLPKTAQLFQM